MSKNEWYEELNKLINESVKQEKNAKIRKAVFPVGNISHLGDTVELSDIFKFQHLGAPVGTDEWNDWGAREAVKNTGKLDDGDDIEGDEPEEDMVNHPNHYNTAFSVEVINTIMEWVAGYKEPRVAYLIGTVCKYLARAPYKHESPLQDLKKARFYLDKAIEILEGKYEKPN